MLLVLGAGVLLFESYRAYRSAVDLFTSHRMPFELPQAVPGLEALQLRTPAGTPIAASFVPPQNHVAIVVAHGSQANRAQLWPDVVTLARAGYGVLAFDWPGHGESGGQIHFGTEERAAFEAAVDFLSARPDVQRISAYGFSNGGGLLTAFVADEPRVKSLLAVGAWTDAVEQSGHEFRRWGGIRKWPAEYITRRQVDGGNLRPLDLAPKLVGRPTLFVAGTADGVVMPVMSVELAHAAGGRLWLIPDAHHGDYREVAPDWVPRMLAFFAPTP
ncbi:MAG: alpha/beta fold hydrolase [Archangiaceae bacterium]|nr:alpha/beta fold hydrolase [Archangiaceae bacterium]